MSDEEVAGAVRDGDGPAIEEQEVCTLGPGRYHERHRAVGLEDFWGI